MKLFEGKHLIALLGVLALAFSGCATGGSKPTARQFEAPQTAAPEPDKNLFSQALKAQNEGRFESAIQLWKAYLSKYPDSFEGHNNLGLVYYTRDALTQALQEFETAYRLQPLDDKIRQNLARALRFKASMLHENREYFKTLVVLARLEQIVPPEEKQAVLFKQEQVEDQIFLQVIKADNSAAYRDFINRFPDGLNAVRAREYLEKHPNRVAQSTSQTKSWISGGEVVADPDGNPGTASSWASSEKPPEYGTASPMATYTPPAPGTGKKKSGDFFGTDDAAVEPITEENVASPQPMGPAAAIPFEDFEKPERTGVEPSVANAPPVDGKDSGRMPAEFNPFHAESEGAAPGLDTRADLKPSPVPDPVPAPPAAMVTPAAEEPVTPAAEATTMASTEPEKTEPVTAPAEEKAAPAETAEMAPAENAAPETVESESERIARIVREEIARAEGAPAGQAPSEPAVERPADVEMPAEMETETPMEVAGLPGKQEMKPEITPAESSPAAEETSLAPASPEAKEQIKPETVSETVAALVPPSPVAEGMQIPEETAKPAGPAAATNPMVVIQIQEGSTLNVRGKPSTQGTILGYLENGDMMPFVSESGDWYQIAIEENLSGWVSKQYSTIRDVPASVPEQASVPPAPAEEEVSTELSPEPAPVTTEPQPPDKEAIVVVDVSEGSTLNVRSLPSAEGAVVDMLFRGDKLPLVKEEGGWYQVRFIDDTTGWISKKFSFVEGAPRPAAAEPASSVPPVPQKPAVKPWSSAEEPAVEDSQGMVTTVVVVKVPEGSSLNVRSTPSAKGRVMGSLKSGDMRPLLEESGDWYQVKLENGQSGWISRKFSGKMDLDSSFVQTP